MSKKLNSLIDYVLALSWLALIAALAAAGMFLLTVGAVIVLFFGLWASVRKRLRFCQLGKPDASRKPE